MDTTRSTVRGSMAAILLESEAGRVVAFAAGSGESRVALGLGSVFDVWCLHA